MAGQRARVGGVRLGRQPVLGGLADRVGQVGVDLAVSRPPSSTPYLGLTSTSWSATQAVEHFCPSAYWSSSVASVVPWSSQLDPADLGEHVLAVAVRPTISPDGVLLVVRQVRELRLELGEAALVGRGRLDVVLVGQLLGRGRMTRMVANWLVR